MTNQMSLITLGVSDISRSKQFYEAGFGWRPGLETPEIAFYQMNGFVLGLWSPEALSEDSGGATGTGPGAVALAHNVGAEADVDVVMDRLVAAGATRTQPASAPPHGGRRGYVTDPDGHVWEIAWNPDWPISPEGYVTLT